MFEDNQYTVKQNLIRNKYQIYNSKGKLILRTKQKLFKLKEEFPFLDSEGNKVFQIKAQNILDIAGDYALTNPEGEILLILNKKFSFFQHLWEIQNPDKEKIATIKGESPFIEFLRSQISIGSFLPRKYSIRSEHKQIGKIKKKLGIRDIYKIKLEEDTKNIPKKYLAIASIAIDALEGN